MIRSPDLYWKLGTPRRRNRLLLKVSVGPAVCESMMDISATYWIGVIDFSSFFSEKFATRS